MYTKVKPKEEELVENVGVTVSLTVSNVGLCMTCRYAEGCTLSGDSAHPVTFCEEFDTHGSTKPPPVGHAESQLNTSPEAGRQGRLYEGLCMDCAGRESCTFPKREGGVWHCEEYR